MSASHQHHRSLPSSPRSEDSASEDDLNLEELDPKTASTYLSRLDRNDNGAGVSSEETRDVIALRNIRPGRFGELGERPRRYGKFGGRRGERDQDTQDLLGYDGGSHIRDATYPSKNVDVGPSLYPTTVRNVRKKRNDGYRSRFGSTLRLPSFMSAASGESVPDHLEQNSEEEHDPTAARHILVGQLQSSRFPPNSVSNAKYTPWSFLPRTLYKEFSFFFNMYFLLVALSQIIPALRIGYLSTYVAPLVFVLAITLGKEAADDVARRRRDAESNAEAYTVLHFQGSQGSSRSRRGLRHGMRPPIISRRKATVDEGDDRLPAIQEEEEHLIGPDEPKALSTGVLEVSKKSRDLKVGDVLKLGRNQRVPADVVFLKSYTAEAASSAASKNKAPRAEPEILDDPALESSVEETLNTHDDSGLATSDGDNSTTPDAAAVGEAFIRTDQLDGETDWKLRVASPLSQALDVSAFTRLKVVAGKPDKKVNEFVGTIELRPIDGMTQKQHGIRGGGTQGLGVEAPDNVNTTSPTTESAPLTIDNTAWANTVLASACMTLAVVVYTGPQTRQALSTSPSRSKTGLLDFEINNLTKILCALTLALSVILVALEGIEKRENQKWYVAITRFLILFSTIIPISLRVNLDMGKTVYARFIERDPDIPGAVVRTSTIPEELGRVEYLLSDKTGTLTQNGTLLTSHPSLLTDLGVDMELKKLHVGTVSYANEVMDEVAAYIRQALSVLSSASATQLHQLLTPSSAYNTPSANAPATRTRREIGSRVRDLVLALALCHNVTPTVDEENGRMVTSYQASSPDEVAIIRWTESIGLRLVHRDRHGITLSSVDNGRIVVRVRILHVFPFTSETKRMGIIVQFFRGSETTLDISEDAGEIWFYQKGADTVMSAIVAANDWLEEETANMAREGLRTLVVGRKKLSVALYREFSAAYLEASMALQGRESGMAKALKNYLERDLELLGVTGVEDKLQHDIKPSLELLRNAGIKIWMLTGDKVETARCVAVSAKLVARGQYIHTITSCKCGPHCKCICTDDQL